MQKRNFLIKSVGLGRIITFNHDIWTVQMGQRRSFLRHTTNKLQMRSAPQRLMDKVDLLLNNKSKKL